MSKQCINCNRKISSEAKRCRSCAAKKKWRDGVFDDEYCRKMSESVKAAHEYRVYKYIYDIETRRKMSEKIKALHEQGFYDSEEYRRKVSEGVKIAWARGDFDEMITAELCRKRSENAKLAHANGVYDGVYQSPTSIELELATALDICGIDHISQYRPDGIGWVYDEFISPNILIEAHGDYWHSTKNGKNRDIQKAKWAKENDYLLVVLWEHEIRRWGASVLVHERVLIHLV